ncbi:DUF2971 domain-containing protein [Clostridium botulinum]|nr:DUF2971 domain-containing protein [Clostridium botulinum]MCS4461730.1 DUF2971 domain-containing protein [Clostridium botulinum]
MTKSDFLNDEKELVYFYDVLKEVVEGTRFMGIDEKFIDSLKRESDKILENTFILSFTKDSDSLPLWEMYSKGKGYNLEITYDKFFDARWQEKVYISNNNNNKIYLTRNNDNRQFFGPTNFVVYDRSLQKEKIYELLKGIDLSREFRLTYPEDIKSIPIIEMQKRILSEFVDYMVLFKDESFSYENEFRIVYNIIDCDQLNIVKHRIINDRIVPYIELGIEENVIDSVTISPRLKSDILSVKGLNSFINSINNLNESDKISVACSQHSIR